MKSREHYSPEFRAEAVRLVLAQGLSQIEAARRLGIAKGTLANWVIAAKGGQEKSAPGGRSVAELEAEVARLRKALAQANMERDIIKNRLPGHSVAHGVRNTSTTLTSPDSGRLLFGG